MSQSFDETFRGVLGDPDFDPNVADLYTPRVLRRMGRMAEQPGAVAKIRERQPTIARKNSRPSFRTIGKQVSAFRTNSLETFVHELFMFCTLTMWVLGGNLTPPLKGERPWLGRSAQPSWLHLWLSLLLPLHRLQRPKKASPTNKASPYNADPTRRTSRLGHMVRAAISRAARNITKDQKQKNMVAIRQRIAEMR
jgi:hypothetical protein